jgi:DNA-binding transcriptional MerR regulator
VSDPSLLTADSQRAEFADGKEEGALRTIGEVAKALGIRQHVLRYWEEQFPMLKPLKRSGGRRYYRPEDMALVETIDRLVHREGFTLRGARLALTKDKPGKTIPTAGEQSLAAAPTMSAPNTNFAYRARLIALRTTLVKALHDS